MGNVTLRGVREGDLPTFFDHQSDLVSSRMAAFTAKDPSDRVSFLAHWHEILEKDGIVTRTVVVDGVVAGYVAQFEMFDKPSVAFWFGREHWGKGIGTYTLQQFLRETPTRPLFARVAKDNRGSIRVLAKCGFIVCGEDKGFANARGEETEELIFRLPP